jgi:CBS domain-containing protein
MKKEILMSAEKILNKFAIKEVFTISEDASVEEALHALNEHNHRAAPVIDDEGVYKGMFSSHEVIKSLLPSYLVGSEMNLDFAQGLSPHLAEKLRDVFPSRVGDHVSANTDFKIISTTPSLEALRILTKYGSPIPLVDSSTGKLTGLISDQSAITGLLAVEAEHQEE